jgi:hypothetical protein
MAGTELRLGFAMGGGVSLGTFCGAALTEAIKLFLLFGRDADGDPYDDVVVDVFSGASAGAMSLAVMLRGLALPPRRGQPLFAEFEGRLRAQYGAAYDAGGVSDRRREMLVAAQYAQDLQRQAWVDLIHIEVLLASGKPADALTAVPSLLDSGAITGVASSLLRFPQDVDVDGRRVLGDRVLYACTLANLSPIIEDARSELPGPEAGFVGLTDGMRTSAHRELRVFDLNFVEDPEAADGAAAELRADRGWPGRWVRYHNGPERAGEFGDVRKPRTWWKVASTAAASGAFPFAFAPVVLRRRKYEFGRLWPAQLAGAETYDFSYIDGGTFNNEPIREAFRMAAFLDGQEGQDGAGGATADPGRRVERKIVFVDPFVSEETSSLRVPIHATRGLQSQARFNLFDGVDPIVLATLDRLVPQAGQVLSAVLDEARAVEGDRVFQARSKFKLRDGIRRFLINGLAVAAPTATYTGLIAFCRELLEANRIEAIIPPGCLTLADELARVAREERDEADRAGDAALAGQLQAMLAPGQIKAFLAPDTNPAEHDASFGDRGGKAGLHLRMLVAVAVDLAMDLEGKSASAELIAIAPYGQMAEYARRVAAYNDLVKAYKEGLARHKADPSIAAPQLPPPQSTVEGPKVVNLPGGEISGFAGFMSKPCREHDFDAGTYCAWEFLKACANIPDAPPPPRPRPFDWTSPANAPSLSRGVDALAERAKRVVTNSHLLNLGLGLDGLILNAVAGAAVKAVQGLKVLPERSLAFELRIAVPGDDYELDGTGAGNDIRPIRFGDDKTWYLVTVARFFPGAGGRPPRWEGAHVPQPADGVWVIPIDKGGFLVDRLAGRVRLPSATDCTGPFDLLPAPILTVDATTGLDPATVLARAWTAASGVTPLDGEVA